MSTTNAYFNELAMRKLRRLMVEGSIVGGPSREELFDGLKYFMLPVHAVNFTVEHPVSPETVRLRGRILGIEPEDGSMESWIIDIEVRSVAFDGGFSDDIDPVGVSAYYSTKRRIGHFLAEELTVRDGAVYQGDRKIADLPPQAI
ncbi:hypothetical protein IPM44_02715 [bacterium]|nr:MAG: hypothetical protein IPM44_02715 [bacterium]